MIWLLLSNAASALTILTSTAWVIRVFSDGWAWNPPPIVNRVFFNLRPFYIPAMAIITADLLMYGHPTFLDYIWNAFSWLGAWLMLSEEDDDERWKRRREKLAETVQEAGGKLIVVPAGAPA